MKYYILFGPPGAGKGTHAGAIAQKYNLKHISTGELLRAQIAAGTPLGIKAKALIDNGSLVPDEVVEGMIQDVFNSVKDVDGFLLDGYPRTIPQAEVLDEIVAARGETVTGVISIMIPDSEVHARIARSIETYHAQTEPLIDFYKKQGKYHEVCGYPGSIDEVRERVLALVETI